MVLRHAGTWHATAVQCWRDREVLAGQRGIREGWAEEFKSLPWARRRVFRPPCSSLLHARRVHPPPATFCRAVADPADARSPESGPGGVRGCACPARSPGVSFARGPQGVESQRGRPPSCWEGSGPCPQHTIQSPIHDMPRDERRLGRRVRPQRLESGGASLRPRDGMAVRNEHGAETTATHSRRRPGPVRTQADDSPSGRKASWVQTSTHDQPAMRRTARR